MGAKVAGQTPIDPGIAAEIKAAAQYRAELEMTASTRTDPSDGKKKPTVEVPKDEVLDNLQSNRVVDDGEGNGGKMSLDEFNRQFAQACGQLGQITGPLKTPAGRGVFAVCHQPKPKGARTEGMPDGEGEVVVVKPPQGTPIRTAQEKITGRLRRAIENQLGQGQRTDSGWQVRVHHRRQAGSGRDVSYSVRVLSVSKDGKPAGVNIATINEELQSARYEVGVDHDQQFSTTYTL